MRGRKGFTLLEILVVLLLLSLIFGTVVTVFRTAGQGALLLKRDAERLYQRAFLAYRLRHQLEGLLRSFRLEKREGTLYMGFVTSSGENYPGVVQVRYRYSGGELFYCEKPYPEGEILSCEAGREIRLASLESFEIEIFQGGRWRSGEEGFSGRPEKIAFTLEDLKMVVPVRVGRTLR